MDKRFVTVFVIILLAGILFRSLTGTFGTFMEPDNYIYYLQAQLTIQNNYTIPAVNPLSGFPIHKPFGELPPLTLLPAYAYRLLGGYVSLFNVMLALPIASAILEMIVVYLLTMELVNDRNSALASMFIFAIIPAAIWKNSIGAYRGETFVPLLAAFFVLSLLKAKKSLTAQKKEAALGWAAIGASAIFASVTFWHGGLYVPVILLATLPFIALRSFKPERKYLSFSIALLIAIAGCYFGKYAFGIYNYFLPNASIAEVAAPTLGSFILGYGLILLLAPFGLYFLVQQGKKGEAQVMGAFLAVTFALAMTWTRLDILPTIPIAILGGLMIPEIYKNLAIDPKGDAERAKRGAKRFIMFILFAQFATMLIQVPFYAPADGINAQFIQALTWISRNTPQNATFVSLWPDGSLIEGVAHRQSYSDSISALGEWPIFDKFLFSKQGNFTYLEQIRPDYILERSMWKYEVQGTLEQNKLPPNMSINGTNFQALMNGTIGLPVIYKNNDTTLYCAYACASK